MSDTPKWIKRRVRQRMAETGEKYTKTLRDIKRELEEEETMGIGNLDVLKPHEPQHLDDCRKLHNGWMCNPACPVPAPEEEDG